MPAATKTTTITKSAGPTKPTYSVMVTETLKSLGNRSANSLYVISKELAQKYNIDINKHALSKALKKGVESGDLIQVKASYKLNKTAAPAKKPTKTVTDAKKPSTTTKSVKKSTPKTSVKKSAPKSTTTSKVTKKVRQFFSLFFALIFLIILSSWRLFIFNHFQPLFH